MKNKKLKTNYYYKRALRRKRMFKINCKIIKMLKK